MTIPQISVISNGCNDKQSCWIFLFYLIPLSAGYIHQVHWGDSLLYIFIWKKEYFCWVGLVVGKGAPGEVAGDPKLNGSGVYLKPYTNEKQLIWYLIGRLLNSYYLWLGSLNMNRYWTGWRLQKKHESELKTDFITIHFGKKQKSWSCHYYHSYFQNDVLCHKILGWRQ